MAMRPALLLSIQNWLAKHGHETGSPDIRACLKQWTKAQERDGFALSVPSRWKYFKHFVDRPPRRAAAEHGALWERVLFRTEHPALRR